MNLDFQLCDGNDYPLCRNCKRLAAQYPPSVRDSRHQAWTQPDDRVSCRKWVSKPVEQPSG